MRHTLRWLVHEPTAEHILSSLDDRTWWTWWPAFSTLLSLFNKRP
jgi:hypothetical protein